MTCHLTRVADGVGRSRVIGAWETSISSWNGSIASVSCAVAIYIRLIKVRCINTVVGVIADPVGIRIATLTGIGWESI